MAHSHSFSDLAQAILASYRHHMTLVPPNAYQVEEAPLRTFLHHLDHELGGARAWVERNGVSSSSLKRLVSNLL